MPLRATVSVAERDMVERVLRFANTRALRSASQAESLFQGASLVADIEARAPSALEIYRQDQAAVREALADVASGDERRRRDVARRAEIMFTDLPMNAGFVLRGRRLFLSYRFRGILNCCWFVIGLLLDEDRGLTNRFGQCGAPGCGRFNLSFEGRPRRHCSDAHRQLFTASYAAERVRASRTRRRRQRG